jgi:AbrB family looped-hinge helix DNA binding protein
MRMTSKGQVTIPKHVRDSAGIKPGAELAVVFDEGVIKIHRAGRKQLAGASTQFEGWLKRVKGVATSSVTTAEILAATRGRDDGIRSR